MEKFIEDGQDASAGELAGLVARFEWLYQAHPESVKAESIRQAIAQLKEAAESAARAQDNDRVTAVQQALEEALVHVLSALKLSGVSPEAGLQRAWLNGQAAGGENNRAFHVFHDRVEVRVGDDVRGSWPLFTLEDYQSFVAMARELACPVVHHGNRQLALF